MSDLLEKKNVKRVKNFLRKIDNNLTLIVLEQTAKTAKDAAISLNTEVGAIVKSILFKDIIMKNYYLCLVSGNNFVSLKKLCKITNTNIIKADAKECKKISGFSIGGISPVAHLSKPHRIFIDKDLKNYETIYAAAGNPFVVFGISYKKLLTITNSEENDII